MIRRLLLIVLAALVLLAAALGINTWDQGSRQIAVAPAPKADVDLASAAQRLAGGGRMAIITFHSLEDRIVKHTLRAMQANEPGFTVRTKRPETPGDAEVERNPRARSAKLRALERTG